MIRYDSPVPTPAGDGQSPGQLPTSSEAAKLADLEEERMTRVLHARLDRPFKDVKESLLRKFEREYLIAALDRHSRNLSAASRETGLSRKHIRHLMYKHGLSARPI